MNRAAIEPQWADVDTEQGDGIDLRLYLSLLSKYKYVLVGAALLAAAGGWLWASSITPVYRSAATLLVESEQARIVSIEELYGIDASGREYFQTQIELLKSRDLAERAALELDLHAHPEFDPSLDSAGLLGWIPFIDTAAPKSAPPTIPVQPSEARLRGLAGAFLNRLSIQPVPGTRMLSIAFESTDPELAAAAPNALGKVYIERGLEARLEMSQQAASWLTDRLEVLRDKLRQSEDRFQAFREQEGIIDVGGVLTVTANELDALTDQLVSARQARDEAENALEIFRLSPRDQWDAIGPVISNPVAQASRADFLEARRRVSELSSRYGPKHPNMVAAQSDLEAARDNLFAQIQKVFEGYEDQYAQALANVQSLQRRMEATKGDVQDIQRKEYRLQELQREVETNQRLYDMFLQRFKETSQADLQNANARFVDRALVPESPIRPNRNRIMAIWMFLALAVTGGFALLREVLDNTFKTPADVSRRLQVPCLGLLPLVKSLARGETEFGLEFVSDNRSTFAEATRTIRTGIVLSGLDHPHKVIVVTSSVPGEGKTTFAMNMAVALGHLGKVLLIDADMRRPSLARNLNLSLARGGLSSIIAGEAEFKDAVHRIDAGIDVIPAGVIPPNPLELLSSQRFAKLLNALKERYDRIIIDTAPCQAVSDALVLSTLADGLVFVIKADATPIPLASNAISRLRDVNAHLLGVVLNRVDVDKRARSGYYDEKYGYHGYYDHYGYSDGTGRA